MLDLFDALFHSGKISRAKSQVEDPASSSSQPHHPTPTDPQTPEIPQIPQTPAAPSR